MYRGMNLDFFVVDNVDDEDDVTCSLSLIRSLVEECKLVRLMPFFEAEGGAWSGTFGPRRRAICRWGLLWEEEE